MDFYKIKTRVVKRNGYAVCEIYPDFIVGRTTDLMVQGGKFHAIWDEEKGLWSTDEYDVQRLVDQALWRFKDDHPELEKQGAVSVLLLGDFSSGIWRNFRTYLSNISDSVTPLNSEITFENSEVTKQSYVSKRVPYSLVAGSIDSYQEVMDTLYEPEERAKLEWAVGSILSGDAKYIQKFIVLYGEAGAGKSTFLNIVQALFDGYYTTFEAKALVGTSNTFATEVFRENPLVAIQHDGDLSRIEDNTKLNSIVSHEEMTMNEKFKATYTNRINAFLFMGTNKPVKVTDAKSGIIRRLIDVRPSGKRLPATRYQVLTSQIRFELGAIAEHCLRVYREMGRDYYANYRPVEMILQTDVFANFVEYYYDVFLEQDGCTLKQAYEMYKIYCEDANVEYKLAQYRFREELKNYFEKYEDRARVDGVQVRSYYSIFRPERFLGYRPENESVLSLVLDQTTSLLDEVLSEEPAQYAREEGTPSLRWVNVQTKLRDIDTQKVHYVKVPSNHIVIDFDLKNSSGEKSAELNLKEASLWPPTYTEYSMSGQGVHLHYIYEGDPAELASLYADGIEIKAYSGNASLRRRLSACNNTPIATITSGLPFKEKKVLDKNKVMSEKGLRNLVIRNLKKEFHPGTKPSIDFIYKILTDAKRDGLEYDIRDLRPDVLTFAMNSSNQSPYCIDLVARMPFYSTEKPVTEFDGVDLDDLPVPKNDQIVFFDIEVYPNLLLISWKFQGKDKQITHLFNPTPEQVGELLQFKLIGFNNRRYDNHILYAAYMGYSNEALYRLSKSIIENKDMNARFAAAYGLSYADMYDLSSKKQSLKAWELELGIRHMELDLPWDEPVPDEKKPLVAEYCGNDVLATEAVYEAIPQDRAARSILSDLSGLSINDTTRAHTARIIFGSNRNAKEQFVYTDLSEMFPGYKYESGKSTYRGFLVGEGGFVYSEPGIYEDVVVLDVASMHPTSIEELNLFGPYTEKFSDLKRARIAIKHKDYASAKTMWGGALAPYLKDEKNAKDLSEALKIVINSVYGLTSASFENPFLDRRNVDNIVAKRGALFMIDLKHEVETRGFNVIHIKTDSIKISKPTPEIIDFIKTFGESYGYTFEVEDTFSRFCLADKANYVALTTDGKWKAVGSLFKEPYVFKTLFTHQDVHFEDLCQTKAVKSAIYLDLNEMEDDDDIHHYQFVGRVGVFCPVVPGVGGGVLLRLQDGKYYAVAKSTGYRWLESNVIEAMDLYSSINMGYYETMAEEAANRIREYGDYEWFVS